MGGLVILVPLDGSEQALAALPVAKVLGEIAQASLHILLVSKQDGAAEELRTRIGQVVPALSGSTIDIRSGPPAAEILQVAGEIDPQLIVLCKEGGAGRGKVLGHTAMSVLHNARSPVVLVPPERGTTPWHLHEILVPHDGTPTTSAALRPATELARISHAELLVAHVTGVGAVATEPDALTTPFYVDQPQHEWPAWIDEFVKRVACICPLDHLRLRMVLARGNAATEILQLSDSRPTDLIVLAWRGRWEAPHATILRHILGEAHCPVMVVRA